MLAAGADIGTGTSFSTKSTKVSAILFSVQFYHVNLCHFVFVLIACVNAAINMKEVYDPTSLSDPRSQLAFRTALAQQLMAKKNERQVAVGPDPQPGPSGACNNARPTHTLVKLGTLGRRCRVCKLVNGLRHESRFGCSECNVSLCRPQTGRNCFFVHKNGRD